MGTVDEHLQETIRELEDVRDIFNLAAEYCYAADSQNPEAYASVFAEDGILDVGPMGGQIEGRDAIRQFCHETFPPAVSFSIHYLHNPHIVVCGDTAKGRFYWEAPITWRPTNEAVWQAGSYDDQYVRTEEGWKIKKKLVTFYYATPFDKGWVKERFIGTP